MARRSSELTRAAVLYYRLYYLPLLGVLLCVLYRRAEIYLQIRRALVVMAVLALLAFWLVPMSPPRLALPGIVDLVAEHDVLSGDSSRDLSHGRNHFSAMPSLHVGWSAMGAYAAWLALRGTRPQLRWLVWLFPAVMVGVVITTGNHYVLDVVGSAALVTASVGAAALWGRAARRDPGRWLTPRRLRPGPPGRGASPGGDRRPDRS